MFLTAISTIVMLKTHMHNRLQFGFTRYTRKILSVNCKTLCCPIGLHTGRSSKPANSPKFFVMFYIWLLSTISQMLRPVLQKSKFCSQESFFLRCSKMEWRERVLASSKFIQYTIVCCSKFFTDCVLLLKLEHS